MIDEQPDPGPSKDGPSTEAPTGGASGPLPRFPWADGPAASGMRFAAALAGRPLAVARRGVGLAAELARIGVGRSRLHPDPQDPRYGHPAWQGDPLLRRAAQVHLATTAAAHGLVGDARLAPADDERVRTAIDTVAGAVADTVTAAVAAAGGGGLAPARHAPAPSPRPSTPAAFEVGTHVAATPGAVVLRTPVFELLQYLPRTEAVREVPLVVVPPVRGRYYLADLAPGRSIVEHLVRGGQQVFALSWRNPDLAHADWDVDTYGQAVLDAMDAAEHVARTSRTSLMAFGSGGTITAMLLAHLAAIGVQDRVASVTLAATVLDREAAGAEPGAFRRRQPVLGDRYGEPGDSEVQFWNADTTRVPAGLHRGLVDVTARGVLALPGAASMLGTPLDLGKIDRDCYVIAGADDRDAAWPDVCRSARLLGGACRLVLASGGRLGSLVSPPGEAGTSFRAATPAAGTPAAAGEPRGWIALAAPEAGSWWDDHLAWLGARTGPLHDAPPELGGRGMHALAPAPGDYVLQP